MKPQIILLALALGGIVPAGVHAQATRFFEGHSGCASLRGVMCAATPNSRAGMLDLRTSVFESDSSKAATYCDTLFALGFYQYGPNQEWQKCYDTLKKFIEICAEQPDSWQAFQDLASAAQNLNNDTDDLFMIQFHRWLESVLYLNTTNPEYFCACAELLVPPQPGDSTAQLLSRGTNRVLSLYRWLIQNTSCDTPELRKQYDGARQYQLQMHTEDSMYGNYFPLDTTLPPLDSMEPGLQELLEKHFLYAAVSPEPNAPAILLNVSASPNPASAGTAISFTMGKAAYVRITLYDVLGKQLGASAFESFFQTGNESVPISLAGLPSGTYYARIQTAYGEVQTVKLVKQ